jgi:hypothetical protein
VNVAILMNRRLHIITAREEKQKIPKEIIGSEYLISPPSEGLLESTLLSSPSLRKYKRAVTISIAMATTPNVSPMNSPMRLECPDETEPAWITKKSSSFKISLELKSPHLAKERQQSQKPSLVFFLATKEPAKTIDR